MYSWLLRDDRTSTQKRIDPGRKTDADRNKEAESKSPPPGKAFRSRDRSRRSAGPDPPRRGGDRRERRYPGLHTLSGADPGSDGGEGTDRLGNDPRDGAVPDRAGTGG